MVCKMFDAQHLYPLYALTRAVPVPNTFCLAQVSSLSSGPLILLDRVVLSNTDDAENPTPSSDFASSLAGQEDLQHAAG